MVTKFKNKSNKRDIEKMLVNNNFRNNQSYFSSLQVEELFITGFYPEILKGIIQKSVFYLIILFSNLFIFFFLLDNIETNFLIFIIIILNMMLFLLNFFKNFSFKKSFNKNKNKLFKGYGGNSFLAIVFSIITIGSILKFAFGTVILNFFSLDLHLFLVGLGGLFKFLFIWLFWPIGLYFIIRWKKTITNSSEMDSMGDFYKYQWLLFKTFFVLILLFLKVIMSFFSKFMNILYDFFSKYFYLIILRIMGKKVLSKNYTFIVLDVYGTNYSEYKGYVLIF